MSDLSEADWAKLYQIRAQLAPYLDAIQRLLPEDYRITLIARHLKLEEAQLILTEDDNIEAAANCLLRAEVRDE
jgi:hypothetical protein